MKLVFCAVILIVASIEAREVPKIQIYEIREHGTNGIELRDLELNPKGFKKAESKLLNMFKAKKQNNKRVNDDEQLIEKLQSLKADEGNRISDDAYIYVLSNVFDDNDSSNEEVEKVVADRDERIAGKTRHEHVADQIRNERVLDQIRKERAQDQLRNENALDQILNERVEPKTRNINPDQQKILNVLLSLIKEKNLKSNSEKRASAYSQKVKE